ncbi:MAG: c-type cytochrome [Gammaproteobacteria bacterium]|nr:c-type cytochrome [Gammaproteobacteria bacterium]MDD9824297.1 c-type cytochrome [Gammaproteobacteria bacterium]MDD9863547.1 c-type cytochrome [Gammaproteobacteria bacterium]
MSKERDRIFFQNFAIVVALLACMMIAFLAVARALGQRVDHPALSQAAVMERTAPVGRVAIAGEEPPASPAPEAMAVVAAAPEAPGDAQEAATGGSVGMNIYNRLCLSCHGTGIPGSPQLGDREAWASRMARGIEVLYKNAINGYQGEGSIMPMPARGGDATLSDEEVKAAVDYIVENSQ